MKLLWNEEGSWDQLMRFRCHLGVRVGEIGFNIGSWGQPVGSMCEMVVEYCQTYFLTAKYKYSIGNPYVRFQWYLALKLVFLRCLPQKFPSSWSLQCWLPASILMSWTALYQIWLVRMENSWLSYCNPYSRTTSRPHLNNKSYTIITRSRVLPPVPLSLAI